MNKEICWWIWFMNFWYNMDTERWTVQSKQKPRSNIARVLCFPKPDGKQVIIKFGDVPVSEPDELYN